MKSNKKPWIRLIAIDLDGTLLTNNGVAAPEGARLLKAVVKDGIHVVPATARALDSVVKNLCSLLESNGPVICMNGARVYSSPDGPTLLSLSFPGEIGLEIAELADANGWELSTTVGEITYWRQRPGQALGPLSVSRVVVARNSDAVKDNPVRILTHEAEAIKAIRTLCESKYSDSCSIDVNHRGDGEVFSLGVFPAGTNKGDALDLVLRYLGVNRPEVMAIGDDFGDLPMFARAGISIAMSNAPEPVKRAATAVAPGNDEEGVAWALQEFGVSH